MNLLFHHLKKDVRHLRWLLGLWVCVVLADVFLIGFGRLAGPDDIAALMACQVLRLLLPMLQFLLIVVIVPLLIHDEPQVGATAFWFTRPIPRGLLMASKALFIGFALVLFPIVMELAVMVANRVPVGEVAAVIPELLYDAARSVFPIMALAVLTLNFARFAITGVAIYVAFSILHVAFHIAGLFVQGPFAWASRSAGLALSRNMIGGLLMITTGMTVVAHQYLRRRTAASACIAAAGLLAMMAAGWWWPLNFMRLPDAALDKDELDGPPLELVIASHSMDVTVDIRTGFRQRTSNWSVRAAVSLDGLSPVRDTRIAEIRSRFTANDGAVISSTNRTHAMMTRQCIRVETLQALFPGARIIAPESCSSQNMILEVLSIPDERWMAFRDKQGLLEGEADIIVKCWRIDAELEPVSGSRYRDGATEDVVGEIRVSANRISGILRRTTMTRRYVRLRDDKTTMDFLPTQDTIYAIYHPERAELLAEAGLVPMPFNMHTGRRLDVTPIGLVFPPSNIGRETMLDLDQDWLKGARLVRISRIREGVVTIPFRVADFMIKNPWQQDTCDQTEDSEGGAEVR